MLSSKYQVFWNLEISVECSGSILKIAFQKGVIVIPDEVYLLHPLPDRQAYQFGQNKRNGIFYNISRPLNH